MVNIFIAEEIVLYDDVDFDCSSLWAYLHVIQESANKKKLFELVARFMLQYEKAVKARRSKRRK